MRSSLVLVVLPDPRVADGRCLNWSWDKRQGKPQAKTEQLNIRRERKHRPTLRLLSKTPSFSLKMQRKTFLICFMLPTSAKKSKNRVGHSNVLSITPLSPCPPPSRSSDMSLTDWLRYFLRWQPALLTTFRFFSAPCCITPENLHIHSNKLRYFQLWHTC